MSILLAAVTLLAHAAPQQVRVEAQKDTGKKVSVTVEVGGSGRRRRDSAGCPVGTARGGDGEQENGGQAQPVRQCVTSLPYADNLRLTRPDRIRSPPDNGGETSSIHPLDLVWAEDLAF